MLDLISREGFDQNSWALLTVIPTVWLFEHLPLGNRRAQRRMNW